MSNKHSKNTEKLVLLSLFLCTLSTLPALSSAVSLTWGHVGKYASPIYDEEIKLTDNKPIVKVTYPQQVSYMCTIYNNESENRITNSQRFLQCTVIECICKLPLLRFRSVCVGKFGQRRPRFLHKVELTYK